MVGSPDLMLHQMALAWDRFELDNGLRVVVHEDKRAPLVAVSLSYLVGAKDDPPGRTGLAHLFEHLMFTGTAALEGPFIARMMAAGAVRANAQTSPDITRYHELVPSRMLEFTLFAEADRMAWFRNSLSQELFDQQRDIVLQEKLERENQPFGLLNDRMNELLYPVDHPYRHPVIGSAADLRAATIDEAKLWAEQFYCPSNAVLVIAGDVNATEIREKVAHYFGGIPTGRPCFKAGKWVPIPSGRRAVMQDRGAISPHLAMAWATPERAGAISDFIAVAARLLGGSRNSPLYGALVEADLHGGEALARRVSASLQEGAICGRLMIDTGLAPQASLRAVEQKIRDEIERFLSSPVPEAEFDHIRRNTVSGMLRSLSDIETKAWVLSDGEAHEGNPDDYLTAARRMADATPHDITAAAMPWLSQPPCVLDVMPCKNVFTAPPAVALAVPMIAKAAGNLVAVKLHSAMLENGLRVHIVTRPGEPGLVVQLGVDTGYADEPDDLRGATSLLGQLPRFGAGPHDAAGLASVLQEAGLSLNLQAGGTSFYLQMAGLANAFQPALDLLGDLILRPRLAEPKFGQLLSIQKESLLQALDDPNACAGMKPLEVLFGAKHPLARWSLGSEIALSKLTPDTLSLYHRQLLSPAGATLILAGDLNVAESIDAVQAALGGWTSVPGAANRAPLPAVSRIRGNIALLNGGEAGQAKLVAVQLLPKVSIRHRAIEAALLHALGGAFGSRLNMRLREANRWTYGVQMRVIETGRQDGQRYLMISASIDEIHARESINEIRLIISEILSSRPVTEIEFSNFKNAEIQRILTIQQHAHAVVMVIDQQRRLGQPMGDWSAWVAEIHKLKVDDIAAMSSCVLDPAAFSWVITGNTTMLQPQFSTGDIGVELVM